MSRKPEGDHPLSAAERQARQRARRASQAEGWRRALERIVLARTAREAREIASEAIGARPLGPGGKPARAFAAGPVCVDRTATDTTRRRYRS
jgi:hypothetical protein